VLAKTKFCSDFAERRTRQALAASLIGIGPNSDASTESGTGATVARRS
jgi:hypothetical protein